jgi:hypothetical protein
LRLEPEGRFGNLALGDDPLCKGLRSPPPAFLQSHRHGEFGSLGAWEPGSLGVLRSWEVGKLGSWNTSPIACVPAQEKAIPLSVCGRDKKTRRTTVPSYSNAAGRCQKVEPGRVADGGDRGSASRKRVCGNASPKGGKLDVCAVRSKIARESPPEPGLA